MKRLRKVLLATAITIGTISMSGSAVLAESDNGSEKVTVQTSPDKYTWYINDYVGKNVAAFGYTAISGYRMESYGAGTVKFVFVAPDGAYVDPEDDEILKKYVVTGQNIKPNSELKYTFMTDENGEEYDLVESQNIDEVVLAVKEVGSDAENVELTEINIPADKYTQYVRDYVGMNLASCGYESLGGEYRDEYGEGTLKLVIVPDDGSYIEPSDIGTMKNYVITGQNIEPNTEIKYEMMTDSNGEEYSLVSGQNIESIELYVTPIEE